MKVKFEFIYNTDKHVSAQNTWQKVRHNKS